MDQPLTTVLAIRDVDRALDFYEAAFSAVTHRVDRDSRGRASFAAVTIRGTPLFLVGEDLDRGITSPLALGGTVGAMHLRVDDVDSWHARLVKLGASSVAEARDTAWGDRWARVRCPFGHVWQLAAPICDPPHPNEQTKVG